MTTPTKPAWTGGEGDGPLAIDGFHLWLTCSACPEQYDVYLGDLQVGYLRLRHGEFRADYPDCGGETVYEAATEGDGRFEPGERMTHLTAAVTALHQALSRALPPVEGSK